jgi:hypothetical protein
MLAVTMRLLFEAVRRLVMTRASTGLERAFRGL